MSDAGALPAKHEWKIARLNSVYFEEILNLRRECHAKTFEKIIIKGDLKCLEVEPSYVIDGGMYFSLMLNIVVQI